MCGGGNSVDHAMDLERFRALVESTTDWMWETDERGIYTFSSSKVRDTLGYDTHEVLGRSPFDFMTPEEGARVAAIFAKIAAERKAFSCLENTNIRKDGSAVVLETSGVPLFREDGSFAGYRGIDRDVTWRKAAETALQRAKEAAEQANREKDAFLARISHELRTPLAPILNAVNVMEETGGLSPEISEYVAMMRRNVEMESRLVDDLLDISRIVQGKIVLRPARIDAREQFGHILYTCQADIEAKKLNLVLDDQATRTWVEVDLTRYDQVLLNVIRNAIKFTPAGGTITIATRNPTEGELAIAVTDTGIGISEHALARIFRAFEQGGQEVTQQFGGLGLGLAIAKTLVELQGGTISAYSEGVGKGASFTVTLPTVEPAHEVTQTRAERPHRQFRILLVDDHTDTLKVLGRLLKTRGHSVATATSVAEAKQAVSERDFDLLISDLGLPDGSGTDLMQDLSARGLRRGIALSGFGMEADIKKSRDSGFCSHLTKPVDFKVLVEHIDAAMAEC